MGICKVPKSPFNYLNIYLNRGVFIYIYIYYILFICDCIEIKELTSIAKAAIKKTSNSFLRGTAQYSEAFNSLQKDEIFTDRE